MDSDEWEYEYSTTETESLYFTLDLTTHVPDALVALPPPSQSAQSSKQLSAARRVPENDRSSEDPSSSSSEEEEEHVPKLQILDLHTPNPLIKFDQSLFSCYWTTDLGTQFHIAQAGQTPHPLRKGTVLDILGITRARLIGKPIQLLARNPIPSTSRKAGKSHSPTTLEDDDTESMVLNTGPLRIPRAQLKTTTSKSQASFLERLSAIKAQKGEDDQVPIIAIKQYTLPENWESIKRKAEDDDRNNALENPGTKYRRRHRPRGILPRRGNNAGRKGRGEIEGRLGILFGEQEGEERVVDTGMFVPGDDSAGVGNAEEEQRAYESLRRDEATVLFREKYDPRRQGPEPLYDGELGYLQPQPRREYENSFRERRARERGVEAMEVEGFEGGAEEDKGRERNGNGRTEMSESRMGGVEEELDGELRTTTGAVHPLEETMEHPEEQADQPVQQPASPPDMHGTEAHRAGNSNEEQVPNAGIEPNDSRMPPELEPQPNQQPMTTSTATQQPAPQEYMMRQEEEQPAKQFEVLENAAEQPEESAQTAE